MDELKKGDHIFVSAIVCTDYSSSWHNFDARWKVYKEPEHCRVDRIKKLYRNEFKDKKPYVFIGWTYRSIGCYLPGSDMYDPPVLDVSNRIRVAVIVPIEDDARYFTPVLCLLEDISE